MPSSLTRIAINAGHRAAACEQRPHYSIAGPPRLNIISALGLLEADSEGNSAERGEVEPALLEPLPFVLADAMSALAAAVAPEGFSVTRT